METEALWPVYLATPLETMLPFTVHGFCEPGRVLCTISYWNCYIVHCIDEDYEEDTEEIQTEYIHKNMMKFCEDLHRDIKENIDDWCKWFRDYEAETEEEKMLSMLKSRCSWKNCWQSWKR